MPAKKGIEDAPVYSMAHERQVELLSEALLREYMHKRKFTETLRVFDEENPRGSDTITSRALMSDLMALKPETQKSMKNDGVETIMEMLCCLRVQRRMEVEELKRRASAEVPSTPEKTKAKKAKKAKKKKDKQKSLSKESSDKQSNREKGRGVSEFHKFLESSGSSSDGASSRAEDGDGPGSVAGKETNLAGDRLWGDDEGGSQIGGKLAVSLLTALCSSASSLKNYTEQGFSFDQDLEYALVQWKRGPDGIITVVQAFVCAFFFKGSFVDVQRHQRHCLLRSLTTILCGVQPSPHLICLVDGSVTADKPEVGIANMTVLRKFTTTQEIEDTLCPLLEKWMQPKGSGLMCFLLSVMLSAGIEAITSLIGSQGSRLIDSEGRCTVELVRLLLSDESTTSTALDDDDVLGELSIGMGPSGPVCGYIVSDHGVPPSGDNRPPPRHPVWLLHHGDRLAVLFLKRDNRRQLEQRKGAGVTISTDAFFYSPATHGQGEIFLTLTTRRTGDANQHSERSDSFLGNAIHSITLWSDGDIDWNGSEPSF
ncbi:putative protein of unknown function (DUF4205) [Trypanosoma vivax]|uniref:Probable ubiquitin carboxyl-terminal hydrolase MINDY-4 n=1 Tax=Trypanosoma vivax (strain Y486) TaxID=1055687 RepID=G0U3T2_TRYVY|nr:putative protein of unknown function (DUF4205) [Trypanosoma vivax]CCC50941.1 conserved hypothetical protein [Trypanosoma vivax Y486]